jgi:hypothetical protein
MKALHRTPIGSLGLGKFDQVDKHRIREWMNDRQQQCSPPPDIEQIQREVGWRIERAGSGR